MTPDAYLRAIASALTGAEDRIRLETRDDLYELAYRIRAYFLSDAFPEEPLLRQVRYRVFRNTIAPQVQRYSDRVYAALLQQLPAAEGTTATATAGVLGIALAALPPRDPQAIATTTRVLGTSVLALFTPSPTTGVSPFTEQLLRILDRMVAGALFRGDNAEAIANAVAPPPRTVPAARARSALNAWRSRTAAIVASTLWALPPAAASRAPVTAQWRWNAILDPKTCPVCWALDGTEAPFPAAFPQGPPPLHPYCRCILTPVTP